MLNLARKIVLIVVEVVVMVMTPFRVCRVRVRA